MLHLAIFAILGPLESPWRDPQGLIYPISQYPYCTLLCHFNWTISKALYCKIFGEEFFQPKMLLLEKGIFAKNTALLGTHMYAAGADILSEFLVGLWL